MSITESNGGGRIPRLRSAGSRRRPGAAGMEAARVPLRDVVHDRLLDALLEQSKDAAGGLRLTGAGSMFRELVAAVLERALHGPEWWRPTVGLNIFRAKN